jgi:hypothetical protein
MGQREAIVQYLVCGGIIAPVIVLSLTAALLGPAAIPVAIGVMWLGFAVLIVAKWPLPRRTFWRSFGPAHLSAARRKLYWCAYMLLASGLLLTLFGYAFLRLKP